jgi:hypothetical protein
MRRVLTGDMSRAGGGKQRCCCLHDFSSGADGTGRTRSRVSRSAVVVLANKYQGHLGSARNSAAEIARGDVMKTD